jgi:hypothetical protein
MVAIVQSLTTTMLNEEVILFTPGVAGSTYGIVDVVVTV